MLTTDIMLSNKAIVHLHDGSVCLSFIHSTDRPIKYSHKSGAFLREVRPGYAKPVGIFPNSMSGVSVTNVSSI